MSKQLPGRSAPAPAIDDNPFVTGLLRFGKRALKKAARSGLEEFGDFLHTEEAKPIKDGLQMAHVASGGVLKIALHQLDQALDPDADEPKKK